jgi:histidinol-phosphate aminotransferase
MGKVIARPGLGKIRDHMVNFAGDLHSGKQIFLNSNESVFGPSANVASAIRSSLDQVERYPENASAQLARALGARFNHPPEQIVCGHGSDDLLARLSRAYLAPGDELVYSRNGYPKIPNYAFVNDAIPVAAPDRNFAADVDSILSAVTDRTRIVMIANPDNPNGMYLSEESIYRLHSGLREDCMLVLDSAYVEYVDAKDFGHPAQLVERSQNVVMTRTFSKIFGLAGLRLGWMYAPESIANVVSSVGITFPVSTTALAAGIVALEDKAHTDSVFRLNLEIRGEFSNKLERLGLEIVPSQTNFVLVGFPTDGKSAVEAHRYLEANGVITRRLASPAYSNYIRFTIGIREDMETTAQLLKDFLSHAK